MHNDIRPITIYHFNKKTQKWSSQYFKGVIQSGEGASFNKGYTDSDRASIWIFYKDNPGANISTICIGDVVVKGTGPRAINTQADIEGYAIQKITTNDFGSKNMQHVQIEAK